MSREKNEKKREGKVICLNDEIEDFLRHLGLSDKMQEIKIISIWEKCVGENIAMYSKPVMLKKHKLYVSVESSVWRQELFLKKNNIIDAFNREIRMQFPGEMIKEILFI